jgi:hypothetical protein
LSPPFIASFMSVATESRNGAESGMGLLKGWNGAPSLTRDKRGA